MNMDPDAIPNLLQELRDQAPDELQVYFIDFEDYWERKLWHELTDRLLEYFQLESSGEQTIPLFDTFIKSFANKINQLKLVELGLQTVEHRAEKDRLDFLKTLARSVDKPASQDAYVYATSAVAGIHMMQKDLEGAKKSLDECERILETFDYVENSVHASFYRTCAEYYKNEFAEYYKNALLYLACVDVDDLDEQDRRSRAYDLSIAALVSDSIYNFGELLLHPILDSLKDTKQSWLVDLLFAFNGGQLAAYEIFGNNIAKNNLLKEHKTFLYMKISLACLTEAVFRRPPHQRAMTFSAISQETRVSADDVEHLIMKALSLGLLKGTIDQVEEVAHFNWVQPKVLDKTQIEGMRDRLKEWDSSVNHLGNYVEKVGKDVWAT
ncbi:hypothetical protein M011DRAFT_18641 [Sporormia fimetaria CBS 119925]|uniref:PCI domain-containing protein n=1 Tax=Sporormia fimetaria CBS 119925 TaxID=1340428 RepID=A0A6A6VQW6_9PLEO|nr:hypothetical protein M011DRAFT_18641 [Sporormia fimetaria CBS 119925]